MQVRRSGSSRTKATSRVALVAGAVGALASLPVTTFPASAARVTAASSGEIPIIFNDRTVHATPDFLKAGRVLAALSRSGHIYVPLRGMFEAMGAVVSVSADGTTFRTRKGGTDAAVTLGKPEVVINGEARPLDVPPMMYKGVALVPVRVLSEALGAYVQWIPERRLVVVRYLSVRPVPVPTPVPTPIALPTARPTEPPTPLPSVAPKRDSYRGFVQAAVSAPKSYNEFSAGQYCLRSFAIDAAYSIKDSPVTLKVDYRQDVYVTSDNLTDLRNNHYTSFATLDGGNALTPVFLARQSTVDARAEYQIAAPRINVGLGYLHVADNFGYPHADAAGFGIEKLPDLHSGINPFGSAFYYPSVNGEYTVSDPKSANAGRAYRREFAILKYDVGLALVIARSPVYLHAGFAGDRYAARRNAPVGQTHAGPYVGLGVKL